MTEKASYGRGLPDAHLIPVECLDPKTLKKEEEMAACFLPHMVFASLTSYSSFSALFGVESLETFWRDAEKCGDDRLDHHPMTMSSFQTP